MEKAKRFRENLRKDPRKWQEFKEKERERGKEFRQRRTARHVDVSPTKEGKKKMAAKKRKYREMKRLKEQNPELSMPYKNKQSLNRAVNRVRKSLPACPTHSKQVLNDLFQEFHPEAANTLNKTKEMKARNYRRESLIKSKVTKFYLRDDISYQTPGMTDVVSIRDEHTKQKIQMQKRYLVMTIAEAYEIFISESDCAINKTKFYELRPEHIKLVADTPHNVCVCQKHANFQLLCDALKLVPKFPSSYKELLNLMCCNTSNETCMIGSCNNCETDIRDILPFFFEYDTHIYWKKWEKDGRIKIVKHRGTVENAIVDLQNQYNSFKKHFYINHVQSHFFEKKKNCINDDEMVLQIDFSENFAIINQDEVQAAHFSYEQVTIFTACAWFKTKTESLVIVSDDLTHDKNSVWTFLDKLLNHLLSGHLGITKVAIFSDGSACQFKNRYILSSLPLLSLNHHINLTWSFFATSHGKGAVDGIGGTIKRCVWNGIKSRRIQITSAEEFARYASLVAKNIHVTYIEKADVQKTRSIMEQRWSSAKKIPNIQSQHHFEISNETEVLVSPTVGSRMTINVRIHQN